MGTIYRDATIVPSKVELVAGWIGGQRWYAGKSHAARLHRVGGFRFEDPAGEVGIETLLLADTAATPPVVYQVPLTYRADPLPGGEAALVGTMEHSVLGTRWVYDGPHDPVYVAQLVAVILGGERTEPTVASAGSTEPAVGTSTGLERGTVTSSAVLVGEQSNTSVICRMADPRGEPAEPLIVKVFRTVQDGENPDVVVQSALTAAGSARVPTSLGYLSGGWDSPDGSRGEHGHLAFAQEFIPGAPDAWRVALPAATAGADFAARARELGVATAEIHRDLAARLGTTPADEAARARLVTELQARYAAAVEAAPTLADRGQAVEAVWARLRQVDWPALQRIHGDYHLGQVLDVPERGWVALDFEGEPLRPLAERTLPNLRERDLAGMLRSFDYVAASVHRADPTRDASGWATACRAAFLAGYAELAGGPSRSSRILLRALELDKALYEVVYEARNRPSWVSIPLSAIDRLLDQEDPP